MDVCVCVFWFGLSRREKGGKEEEEEVRFLLAEEFGDFLKEYMRRIWGAQGEKGGG